MDAGGLETEQALLYLRAVGAAKALDDRFGIDTSDSTFSATDIKYIEGKILTRIAHGDHRPIDEIYREYVTSNGLSFEEAQAVDPVVGIESRRYVGEYDKALIRIGHNALEGASK